MLKSKIFPTILFLIVLSLSVNATDLRFVWDFAQPQYTAYKGDTFRIYYTITNQENSPIYCTITPTGLASLSVTVPSQGISGYFSYTAPTKIKNLQNPTSYPVSVYCTGNVQSSIVGCGTLFLSPCYENRNWNKQSTVQINFALNDIDKKNLNILEDYRTNLADKIKNIDTKSQKINDLVSKTPAPILPKNANSDNSNLQQSITPVKNRFQNVVNSLEQEDYGLGTSIDKSSDLNILFNTDIKITDLTNSINVNVQRYNQIITNLNNILTEVKARTQNLNFKFNSELISQLDTLGKTTYSQITTYQFKDLDNADSIAKTYSDSKGNLLLQMENNVNSYSNKGTDLIMKNINEICAKFNLCGTKNKIQSLNLEASKNFNDICNAYNSLSSEIKVFNDNEVKRYNADLEELNIKNKEIRDKNIPTQKEIDRIIKINDIKENLNQEAIKIEKNLLDSVKQANSLGKTIDVSKYSKKVDEYNSLKLEEKSIKIKELQDASKEIQTQSDSIKLQQTGILGFFKKIYYGIFGEKQKLETKIQLETNLTLPKLIAEIPNNVTIAENAKIESEASTFFTDSCQISSNKLTEMQANTMNIQVSEKQSQIKTDVKEAEKNCFDENHQRTNKCCDTDDYKSRKDLYPVIFVHGHSFETARGDLQNSLSTFNYMSNYFSQNGYVEESLLYPESSEQLAQGVWAFCDKPVVVRLTYYDGLASGTTHNYKNSISDYSPVLKKEIENVLKATNKDKAIIVSHSMGGILSRYYIKFDGGSNEVYKLITVSSPHYGIRAWASFWSPFGAKESQQMTPNSDFLNLLNNPTDSLVPTYTIGGNDKVSCFTEDCDGVVYVSKSKLKTAVKSVIFDGKQYEHNSILNQPDVTQQALDFIKE